MTLPLLEKNQPILLTGAFKHKWGFGGFDPHGLRKAVRLLGGRQCGLPRRFAPRNDVWGSGGTRWGAGGAGALVRLGDAFDAAACGEGAGEEDGDGHGAYAAGDGGDGACDLRC